MLWYIFFLKATPVWLLCSHVIVLSNIENICKPGVVLTNLSIDKYPKQETEPHSEQTSTTVFGGSSKLWASTVLCT